MEQSYLTHRSRPPGYGTRSSWLSLPGARAVTIFCATLATMAMIKPAVGASLGRADVKAVSQADMEHGVRTPQGKSSRMSAYFKMIDASLPLSFDGKIQAVNDFYNKRIAYQSDRLTWNARDYWATPVELLTKGAGDCEDFAIAKYFALEQLGIHRDAMKITYVLSSQARDPHMVLLVFKPGAPSPLVLDNLIASAWPLRNRKELSPVYSFNEGSFFMGVSSRRAGSTERLSRWMQLLDRIREEKRFLILSRAKNPYDTAQKGRLS